MRIYFSLWCVVAALIVAMPAVSPAQGNASALPADICGIVGGSVEEIRVLVTATSGIEFEETLGNYDTYVDVANRRLWTFTRTDSILPPSVICRTVLARGSGSQIIMHIVCYGENQACQTLRDEWEQFLDRPMQDAGL